MLMRTAWAAAALKLMLWGALAPADVDLPPTKYDHAYRGQVQYIYVLSDDLPTALEQVTRLGLKKLERVLRVPLDPTDGNLVRSQVTAAIGAINAQLRADEHQLRRKTQGDALQRLLKIIEEEQKKLSKTSVAILLAPEQQHTEHVELERSDAEATVMASGGDGPEEGYHTSCHNRSRSCRAPTRGSNEPPRVIISFFCACAVSSCAGA
jgi:hypothetical protein